MTSQQSSQRTVQAPRPGGRSGPDPSGTAGYSLRSSRSRQQNLRNYAESHTGADVTLTLDDSAPTASVRPLPNSIRKDALIVIPTKFVEQKPEDIPRKAFDFVLQYAWVIHECGHIEYTDIEAAQSAAESHIDTPIEPLQDLAKRFWNAIEDGFIEGYMKAVKGERIAKRIERKNRWLYGDQTYPESFRNDIYLPTAIHLAAFGKGKYDTGVLEQLRDPTNDHWTFADEETRYLFEWVFPAIEDCCKRAKTEPDPWDRADIIFETIGDIIDFLLDQKLDDETQDALEDAFSEGGNDFDTNYGSGKQAKKKVLVKQPSQSSQSSQGTGQSHSSQTQPSPDSSDTGDSSQSDSDSDSDSDSPGTETNDSGSGTDTQSDTDSDGSNAGSTNGQDDDEPTTPDSDPSGDADGASTDREAPSDEGASDSVSADTGRDSPSDGAGNSNEDREGESDSESSGGTQDGGQEQAESQEEASSGRPQKDDGTDTESGEGGDSTPAESASQADGDGDSDDTREPDLTPPEEANSTGNTGQTELGDFGNTDEGAAETDSGEGASPDEDAPTDPDSEATESDGGDFVEGQSPDGGEPGEKSGDSDEIEQGAQPDGSHQDSGKDTGGESPAAQPDTTSQNPGEETPPEADDDATKSDSDQEDDAGSPGAGDPQPSGRPTGSDSDTGSTRPEPAPELQPSTPEATGGDGASGFIDSEQKRAEREEHQEERERKQREQAAKNFERAVDNSEQVDKDDIKFDFTPTASFDADRWEDATDLKKPVKKVLEKRLEMEQRDSVRRGQPAGQVDTARLYAIPTGSVNVMKRRERGGDKEYTLILVLDRSGSMRHQIETAEEVIAGVALAAEELGIDVCIIDMYDSTPRVVSPFNTPVEQDKEKIMTGMTSGGTPLTDVVAIAKERLAQMHGDREALLMSVNDGKPRSPDEYLDEIEGCNAITLGLTLLLNQTEGSVPRRLSDAEGLYDLHRFIYDKTGLKNAMENYLEGLIA